MNVFVSHPHRIVHAFRITSHFTLTHAFMHHALHVTSFSNHTHFNYLSLLILHITVLGRLNSLYLYVLVPGVPWFHANHILTACENRVCKHVENMRLYSRRSENIGESDLPIFAITIYECPGATDKL